jgi:hypothetical protein
MNKIIAWFRFRLTDKFTVAHDLSPFAHPLNRREELEHVKGLWYARYICRKWVALHPMGRARIIKGWHYWPEND